APKTVSAGVSAGISADASADAPADTPSSADKYLGGFHLSPYFLSGPAGYDTLLTAHASDLPDLGLRFARTIEVHITGAALLYDVAEPVGTIARPVKELEAEFPGIRRIFLENYVRYSFERYGVPYVVSVLCFDGGARYRMISCHEADKVAQ